MKVKNIIWVESVVIIALLSCIIYIFRQNKITDCYQVSSTYYNLKMPMAKKLSGNSYENPIYARFTKVFQEIHDLCMLDIGDSKAFDSYSERSRFNNK